MRKFYDYAQLPILVIVAVSTIFYFNFTAEDAYITYRYAENLVNIGALVYNEGEPINAMTCAGRFLSVGKGNYGRGLQYYHAL